MSDIKIINNLKKWFLKNKVYFIAFAIPVTIMYTAYAIFKIYPFGDRSVLALDLNGQYVYYYEALKDAVSGSDKSVFYNWSRNLSGGFAGIIGYYLASPFNIIVLLLPGTMLLGGLLIIQLAKLGTAGVTFCCYLRRAKHITDTHSLIFSTLYALCAYGVIQLMNPMWLDGMVFLPLIILGIEYLVDSGRKLRFIIPLAVMLISNFYIGYMICIFIILYYMIYVIFIGPKKSIKEIFISFIRITVSSLTAVICAAFMLLPVYNALKLGKFDFSEPDFSFKTQFRFGDFFAQLMTGQYDSITNEGHPEIYCGIFTVVLLPLFFLNREINVRKKTGYFILISVMTACMYIRPLDIIWHGFQMPVWMPFRYSFIISFLLLSMAAETYKNIKGSKLYFIGISFTAVLIFLLVVYFRIKENDITTLSNSKIPDITKKDVYISAFFTAMYSTTIFAALKITDNPNKNSKIFSAIIQSVIIVLSCGELLYNCSDTLKSEDKDTTVIYSDRSNWYNFSENGRNAVKELYNYDNGFYRAEKTFHRMTNDNAALGLRGVSHFSSVMNSKSLEFLKNIGYSANTYFSRYDGATPVTDSILGIKYTMDKNLKKNKGTDKYIRLSSPSYTSVFGYEYTDENDQENIIDVYRNPFALSLGFMADKSVLDIEKLSTNDPFYNQNMLMSAISGKYDFKTDSCNEYFKRINVDPDKFILNNVTVSPYGDHTMYTAGTGDPTVDIRITVPSEKPIYLYFSSDYENAVNLWLSNEQNENGEFINYRMVNTYFGIFSHCTMYLGSFKAGDVINLRMTVSNGFTIIKDFLFYQFDEELFSDSIERLKQDQWELTRTDGNTIEGTITAKAGQIMFTSIPSEPGWKITVDGKKAKYTEIVQALIGINVPPGSHTIKMTYTPPGLVAGIILSFSGIALTVFIYLYDRKKLY